MLNPNKNIEKKEKIIYNDNIGINLRVGETMKTKIKIIIITIIALIMLVLGLILAINTKKESIKNFQDGGYIISNVYKKNNDSEINKIYFDAKAQYTKHANDEYSFNNSDGKKNVVTQDNFVHYNNNSIMALKDGVAIDLTDIDSKIISYYNIFSESILTKTSKGYEINNLNENLSFQKLLFKISDKKYLMAADNIVISFSDSQTVSLKNYVEIEYINKNVIKLYNDESEYQTIASNLYLISDNIKINLEYKTISKNNIKYLTMADMVINADDNIEVLPEEKLPVTPADDNNQGNNQNNQGNQGNNQGNNQNNGGNDIDISDQLGNLVTPGENVDNEDNFIQPTFTVESMEVTSIGFENLKITLEDKSSVLYGNRQVELVDNSTGTVLENLEDWDEGSLIYTINYYTKLKPNSEYTLNIKGQYKIEDTVYDRTFVSKIFRTLDIGLEITEDYVTSDTVSFAIYRNAYSKVKAFSYVIVDSDDQTIEEETKVSYDENSDIVYATTNSENPKKTLRSNTNYKLKITKIQYDADEYSADNTPNLSISHKLKTLKQKPTVESAKLQAILDNQKNTIQLSVDNLIDNNNGIRSITYNVYSTENNKLIQTITQNEYKPITLSVDDLGQGQSYYFSVTVEFDDNQKTIIYTSNNSNIIGTSLIKYPKVVGFTKGTDNGAEQIQGEIRILDEENYIYMKNINKFFVVIKENSGIGAYSTSFSIELGKTPDSTDISLPISVDGLKPNTEYILNVYLESSPSSIYIGYETVKTSEPEPIYLTYENLDSNAQNLTNEMFGFTLKINQLLDVSGSVKTSDNLGYMKLELQKCNSSNKCETLQDFSRTVPKTQNQTEELSSLKAGNPIVLKASEFSFYSGNYNLEEGQYYRAVIRAISTNDYEFPIKLKVKTTEDEDRDKEKYEAINSFKLNIIDNIPDLEVKVTEVPNSECSTSKKCEKDNTLDDDTIIGYNLDIKPIKSTKGQFIKSFKYEIYESEECTEEKSIAGKNPISDGSLNEDEDIESVNNINLFVDMKDKKLSRGNKYCLKYITEYENEKGERVQGKVNYVSLFSFKQAAKIKGYIKNYNSNKIEFEVQKNDPDKAANKLNVISNGGIKNSIDLTKENDKFSFDIGSENKKFKLNILENRGQGESDETIYEDEVDDIISLSKINVVISSSDGKIKIDLPFDESYFPNCNGEGESTNTCVPNKFSNDTIQRIYGLKFADDKYISFNNYGYYYGIEIPSSLFDFYGLELSSDEKNVYIPDFSLIYDSGIINNKNTTSLFIKRANTESNYAYLNSSNDDFSSIQSADIYVLDSTTDKMEEYISKLNKDKKSIIYLNEYNSSLSDIKWIGKRFKNTLIHTNEAADLSTSDEANFNVYDSTFTKKTKDKDKKKYKFEYNKVLELVDKTVIYRTDGAKIVFEINNDSLSKIDKLNFSLGDLVDSNISNIISMDLLKDVKSGDETKENASVTVTKEDQTTKYTVDLKNLQRETGENGQNIPKYYYYSLSYTINNTDEYFYYSGFKLQNTRISTIESLNVGNKSADYKTEYWHFDDEYKLKFTKNLSYNFNVFTNYFELSNDENLVYSVYLQDNSNKEFLIKNPNPNTKLGENENYFAVAQTEDNDVISINNKVLNIITAQQDDNNIVAMDGIFKVVIKPFIKKGDGDGQIIELTNFILNPYKPFNISSVFNGITITPKSSTAVELVVDDTNGVLMPCESYEPSDVMDLKKFFQPAAYTPNPKPNVYNFKIAKLITNEDGSTTAEVKGYAPVGFNIRSTRLELNEFFKVYGNGTYRYIVDYCTIDGAHSATQDVEVKSISKLNLSMNKQKKIDSNTWLIGLVMTNPDPTTKDSVAIVEYTVVYENGEQITRRLSNISGSSNNFTYDVYEKQYVINLSYPVKRNIKAEDLEVMSITVNLYSYDESTSKQELIAQIAK